MNNVKISNNLTQLIKDIELGPVNVKLAAIGKLRSTPEANIHLVQPVLDKILLQAPDESLLQFSVVANLAALGDDRDIVVETLIPYLYQTSFQVDDKPYVFPWLAKTNRNLPGGNFLPSSAQLATVEALSHIRGNDRVAHKLVEIVGVQDFLDWRVLTIYAIGANGNPIGRSTLEYYRDKFSKKPEGYAAKLSLENFGTETLLDIASKNRRTGCFIATAVYGSPDVYEVKVLREFRDEVLLSSSVGKGLVSLYYLYSPAIATLVAKSEFAKSFIERVFLTPVLWLISLKNRKK